MNPGLVVKLRPAGPWRIGPDSGARNRVDVIYHSDSLYSAVTSAMARMGSLEEWLDATARNLTPAVCFSSCFPFLDEIGFVIPPRTIWPPTSPSLMAARVRWKSARFVPLGVVQAILAGQSLDDTLWSVDGASGCLLPAGRPGPFRTAVRWNAAVDRLTGSSERHSTACIEFRPGSGLWTVVSFQDEASSERWMAPVKAAFRLLADTGFGGERSRGWGRAETPEFIDGNLPDMILGTPSKDGGRGPGAGDLKDGGQGPGAGDRGPETLPVETPAPPVEESPEAQGPGAGGPGAPSAEPPAPPVEEPPSEEPPITEPPPEEPVPGPGEPNGRDQAALSASGPESVEDQAFSPAPGPRPPAPVLQVPGPRPPAPASQAPVFHHWLLSLFTPATADTVDWARGNYTLMARGGRVDSPAGSGELKKQIQMVAEGSVLFADGAPRGSAADVAPDGFAHPVFRAGFALSIPLPEVN